MPDSSNVEMGECMLKQTYLRSAVAQKNSLHHTVFFFTFVQKVLSYSSK